MGALIALEMGERPEADPAWDAALATAHRNGSLFAISAILLWRGLGLLRRGDLREAATLLASGQAMMGRWGIASQVYALGFLAEGRVAAGAVGEARAFLDVAGGWGEISDGALIGLRAEAEVLLAEGRPAEALERGRGPRRAARAQGAARRQPGVVRVAVADGARAGRPRPSRGGARAAGGRARARARLGGARPRRAGAQDHGRDRAR